MNKSESIKELAAALSKFQGEVNNPTNTATNPFFSSKYAPLSEVVNVTRPILSKHGLSIVQAPTTEDGNITITTLLMHSSGEWIESPALTLKMDKVSAQGAGSAITYARRYSLSAVLGISSEDDDDGNIAETKQENTKDEKQSKPLSEGQIKRLFAIALSKNIDVETARAQVKSKFNKEVENLTKSEYDIVCKGYEGMKK